MQRSYGLEIPETLEEVCRPQHLALLVYDMQVGILRQIADRQPLCAVGRISSSLTSTCGGWRIA
jgi:hypothetical protein